jgi:hypothetical protein
MSEGNEGNAAFFEKVGTASPNATKGKLKQGLDSESEQLSGKPSAAGPVPRWAKSDDLFWPASETCERLEPGFYRFDSIPGVGSCLRKAHISIDDLIRLPDNATTEVLAEFSTFWTLKDRFTARGFLHKRGILLWGAPGSGKTASLMLMAQDIVQHYSGIVCQVEHPALAAACLSLIRKIEPDRPIVALIEDLDALVERYGENQFLSLLDGEAQVDRIVFVATTNYPERLDKRFVDRPSRIDTIRWIGMPSAAARRVYLEAKEPSLIGAELEHWVNSTEGFSVAHLRELVILVKCFDRPLNLAIARLESMRLRQPKSNDSPDKPIFGIVGSSNTNGTGEAVAIEPLVRSPRGH